MIIISEAKSCADGLFQDVLGRKDKADATRNALNVLQRFKFLFYLPLHIERNIQKVRKTITFKVKPKK
jgi:exocyst complex component 2